MTQEEIDALAKRIAAELRKEFGLPEPQRTQPINGLLTVIATQGIEAGKKFAKNMKGKP